jgi:hypothetical protein
MKTTIALSLAVLCTEICLAEETLKPAPNTTPAGNHAADTKWILGRWVFDSKYTEQKRAEEQKASADKNKETVDLVGALAGNVADQLTSKLEGAQLNFTPSEYVMTTKDGNGKSFRYEVVPSSDPNTASLKESDGTVSAFHRDGERLWMNSTGTVNVPFYFVRVK